MSKPKHPRLLAETEALQAQLAHMDGGGMHTVQVRA